MPRQCKLLATSDAWGYFLKTLDRYDPWGSTMMAFFDVASILHNRGVSAPDDWGYRPGACDPQEVSDTFYCRVASGSLIELGHRLNRLCDKLKAKGLDY